MLAVLARYSFSVSIRSQFCCNFSSPAAHVGEHSAGTSGPAGGSPVLGRYSADGVSQRCAQPLTISMHPSNSSGRIFQFLFTLVRCGGPGGSITVFALADSQIVCQLRLLPKGRHLSLAVGYALDVCRVNDVPSNGGEAEHRPVTPKHGERPH